MELREYLRIARRWAWLFAAGVALAGLAAFLVTTQMTRIYRAEAIVLVNQTQSPAAITYQDVLGSQQLANTYARLAVTDTNLQRAIDSAENPTITLNALRGQVSASVARNTQLITIAVRNADPMLAASLANAIADELPGYIREAQLAGQEAPEVPLNSVFVAQRATTPTSPVSPNTALNVILGLLAGAVVMAGTVAVLEYLTDSIEDTRDIEELGATPLGLVWQVTPPAGVDKKLWHPVVEESASLREAIGRVQANLAFALGAAGAKVILVTSPQPGDGKTTVAVNLASTLGHAARKVLLIDGDLRKPRVHKYFGVHNAAGLSSAFLLSYNEPFSLVRAVSDNFHVLTSGPPPPNPVELLSSAKLPEILNPIERAYDIVVVDAPPILGIADASLWIGHVDAVLLVVRRGKTTRSHLTETLKLLRSSQKPLLGVVINGARPTRSGGYYGYYEYRQDGDADTDGNVRRRRSRTPGRVATDDQSNAAD